MFKINKTLIVSAVLAAAGFGGMAQSRTGNANAIIEARFPSANEAWASVSKPTVAAAKMQKSASASCSREHWPYVSHECLSGKTKRAARTIVLKRAVADAAPSQRS